MKKLWLILPLVLSLLFVPAAVAQSNNSENKVEITSIKNNQTVNRNYLAANERVEIEGTVNGDAFVAGGAVVVSGKINGDLLVAGGEVTISGEVSDDVRVVGGQIRISGKIGKNLSVAGGNIDITESATVGEALLVVGGNVNINAPIGKTINAGVGTLNISNSVGGDIEAGVGLLRLTSKANIKGNITYWSEDEASIDSQAQISGETIRKDPPFRGWDVDEAKILGIISTFSLIIKIVILLSWFVIGLILIKFTPQLFNRSVESLKEKPWQAVGIGTVFLVIVPILSLALLVSVIGIPLGIVLLTLFGISLFFARLPVIYFIGEWVLVRTGQKNHQVGALILGLVIYGLATLLPVIGGLLGFLSILFGLGAWLIGKQQIYTEARKKNLI